MLNHSFLGDFSLATCQFDSMSDRCSLWTRKISILLVTGMAMSTARTVEDGVIKVGAELGRAVLMLAPFADSGIGECNLVNAGSTNGSLGKLHIVDNEMEVERKIRVDHRGKAACFGCGCAQRQLSSPKTFSPVDRANAKHISAFFFHQEGYPATPPPFNQDRAPQPFFQCTPAPLHPSLTSG